MKASFKIPHGELELAIQLPNVKLEPGRSQIFFPRLCPIRTPMVQMATNKTMVTHHFALKGEVCRDFMSTDHPQNANESVDREMVAA